MYYVDAHYKAKNMKTQCCTLSVFYVTCRETIVATTLEVFPFRLVHVIHIVSPDNISSRRQSVFSRIYLEVIS